MENLISGRTYRIETGVPIEKSFKTANNDRPDGLADGKTASLDYSDGAWCRFYRGLSRSVTVDLDGEKSIDGFEITFLQNKSAGIYTPERVELYVSENGDDFMLAYTVESLVSPSSSEVTYSPFRLTDAAKYRARFVKLTFSTDVFAFACGFCVYGGECDGSELPFVPENAKNDCRAMLPKADGFSSTVIIYNGYWDSTMNYSESYVRSTAEMLLPYVGYIGGDGEVYDTMFDSVVFLLLQSRSPSGGKTVFFSNGDGNATVKSDFDYFADNLFANGVNMDALDEAFGIVKKQLNLSDDRKLNVSVQLPYVYKTDLPFGDINGDGADEKAETPDERLAIYEYYVDMISARFASRDYKNITLAAFYQGCEGVPVAMSDDEYGLFRLVNEMLHKKGFRATWIPCFLGTGFDSWKELGFDYAYLQPNYMFHDWQPDSLAEFAEIIGKYGLGAEIEINHTCVLPKSPLFERDRQKYIDYLDYGAKYGYMNAALAFYQGAGPGSMYTAALSGDWRVRNLYDRTYRFIKGIYDPETEKNEEVTILKSIEEKAKAAVGQVKDTAIKAAGQVVDTADQFKELAGEKAKLAKAYAGVKAKEAKDYAGEKVKLAKAYADVKAKQVRAKATVLAGAAAEKGRETAAKLKELPEDKKLALVGAIGAVAAVISAFSGGERKK